MRNFKLGILGAGNMATAIMTGIINSNAIDTKSIIVCDIDEDKLKIVKGKGIATTTNCKELFDNSEFVILAIKPQVAKTLLPTLKVDADTNIISIMAGINIASIKSMLGVKRVTRIMPNTPCLVGCGMCAIDSKDFDEDGQKLVANIFSSLGKTLSLDESLFDAVTAVSGSGPAYVYMFIKAMIDEGVQMGLSFEDAKTLTLQTFTGSAKMVELSDLDVDTLIKNVCSPGGTTIQAVNHYNDNNLPNIIKDGMIKCKNRSEELSK